MGLGETHSGWNDHSSFFVSIPPKLAARAAFLANLHGKKGLRECLTRILRERIELEEIAFAEVKRELKANQSLPEKGVNSVVSEGNDTGKE